MTASKRKVSVSPTIASHLPQLDAYLGVTQDLQLSLYRGFLISPIYTHLYTHTHLCSQLLCPTWMPILVKGRAWYCSISWHAPELKPDWLTVPTEDSIPQDQAVATMMTLEWGVTKVSMTLHLLIIYLVLKDVWIYFDHLDQMDQLGLLWSMETNSKPTLLPSHAHCVNCVGYDIV